MRNGWKVLGTAGLALAFVAVGAWRPAPPVHALTTGLSPEIGTVDAGQEMACNFGAPPEELADRLSPPDSSSVELEAGTVKVCYSSPSARDREIMGGLVPYDQPWRLGANEPTLLQIDFRARIGDVAVEPGSYVLYAIPGQEEWTVAVNGAADRWGVPIDESVMEADVGRTTVSAGRTGEHVESLRISLEDAEDGPGAHLVVEWERTRIVVPVTPR
jgi:hypothetical protein